MKKILLGLVAVGMALGSSALCGEEAEKPVARLIVDLQDGSHLIGTPNRTDIEVHAAFGKVSIPVPQIASLEMLPDRERATLSLRNGDRITGVPNLEGLKLQTSFGLIAVPPEHIRRIVVIAAIGGAQKGLVLWNTLGSEAEIEHSAVGPGGVFRGRGTGQPGAPRGGGFTTGVSGNALVALWKDNAVVAFPREVVSPDAGCIEVWAQCVGFPDGLPVGENPALFKLMGPEGQYAIHLNANDGAANGGLCGRANRIGSCGTGEFGDWTYEQALGGNRPSAWHHYALVWDKRGIPGVGDGAKRMAVFLDGTLNSGRWTDTGADPVPLSAGELALMVPQHLRQGSVNFDNLKVWNYARTNFSDRFDGMNPDVRKTLAPTR